MKVTAFDMVKAKVLREGANLKGSQGVDEIDDESGRPDEPANNLYDEPRDHRSSQGARANRTHRAQAHRHSC